MASPLLFSAPADPVAVSAPSLSMTGPDGIEYPNFTYAGVPGGIPNVPVVAMLTDFGGRPGTDISDALEQGARFVGAKGGGALVIPEGIYYLDRPVLVASSGVVIRGAGRAKTTLVFRWEPARQSVDFIGLKNGDTIVAERALTVAAWNESRDNQVTDSIERLALEINGRLIAESKKSRSNEGPWFALSPDHRRTAELLVPGKNELRATVVYTDGKKAEKRITVMVSADPNLLGAAPRDAAITFAEPTGRNESGWGEVSQTTMARGDTTLRVGHRGWSPGDVIQIADGTGERWFGHPLLVIASVDGDELTFTQPVRRDIEIVNVRRRPVLRGAGLEDLTLGQTSKHWTNLVNFERDYGCWIRGVRLVNAGRNPVAGMMKNFELRDTIVEGVQYHFGVGGGTGYLGFSNSQDCLMEDVQASRLRHAPNFQYGSMGCVIRNSRFEDSDAQLHASPNWENLLEGCVVNSRGTNQSYGSYGACLVLVARPDTMPLGAGIVFYGNDFSGYHGYPDGKAIGWEGGGGTGWIFAYNRFIQDTGAALAFSKYPTGVKLLGNQFIVMSPGPEAIKGDVSQLVLSGNRFAPWTAENLFESGAVPQGNRETTMGGAGELVFPTAGGVASSPAERLNEYLAFLAAARSALAPPVPPVRSIFLWQKEQLKRSTL